MTTATRFEKAYLLQLLRDSNIVLKELQQGIVTLPAQAGPRKSMLKVTTIVGQRGDKSALGKV